MGKLKWGMLALVVILLCSCQNENDQVVYIDTDVKALGGGQESNYVLDNYDFQHVDITNVEIVTVGNEILKDGDRLYAICHDENQYDIIEGIMIVDESYRIFSPVMSYGNVYYDDSKDYSLSQKKLMFYSVQAKEAMNSK